VFAFGANTIDTVIQDPLLIRWTDQESVVDWTPTATNQSGSIRLSRGTQIVTAHQARQEVLVWTDSTLYSLQFLGGQAVWGNQIVGDDLSIISENAVAYADGVAYWMGQDKFYSYDGKTRSLPSDLRRYVFNDFNIEQSDQVFAGTNEAFHEIWWFYCSSSSTTVDRYVVYNYVEGIWYYGTLARTAWMDSGVRSYPLAATYSNNLVEHERGVDDDETATSTAIEAYITSAEFGLGEGDRFAFVKRVLPDMTFDGSTAASPSATATLSPLENSGSGVNSPLSEGGNSVGTVTRTATAPIEAFTGQVYIRVRGRQMFIEFRSTGLGVTWQLGSPRIDMRPDGGRG
jgi:hypothetical protein